ncbi:MAG: SAM-dependent chlorinase/fluorinase [Phycisphaerae bacterium]|nr:SAM-dependent chlorinase/fluorinase [Phycisphaerae bacterium]
MPLITLLTDFGTRDHYVGVLKGVICQIAPKATLVDISHDVAPQNVIQAAFVLRQVWSWYPRGTVHLAVVDPGVGSARSILAGQYAGQYVVAPDNGLLTFVHHEFPLEALHVVQNPRLFLQTISSTFHARDIMAPVAARLATGLRIEEVGPPTDRLEVLQLARPEFLPAHSLRGAVLCADRFGNLITNISADDLAPTLRRRPGAEVFLDGVCLGPVRSHYAEVPPGEPLALVGSSNLLEIAVNRGSAADRFQPKPAACVEVR